jgi:predicted dehydrogenase
MTRKLRMGMVGGGNDAFIGAVHRIAAFMDGKIELVCGSFSVNPTISQESGRDLFVAEDRIYPDYKTMIEQEALLPEEKRFSNDCDT